MTPALRRSDEPVIAIELLFLLLAIAVLRLLLAPGSRSLTSVVMLWMLLVTASYLVGEYETPVRTNFGLSVRTQASFALAYVGYSGMHVIWPWCESLTVGFWLGLWIYVNVLAPFLGLLVRRVVRQRVLFATDANARQVGLLRWWGFECDRTVRLSELADWLRENVDQYGWVEQYNAVLVDTTDYRTEYAVTGVARDYFVDFIGVPSFSMAGYLFGPHPRHITSYPLYSVARRLKRIIDLIIASCAIAVLSPLLLLTALLIKLDSRGPVFYRHRRLGRNMRELNVIKFRTMYRDADRRLKDLLASDPELKREFEATYKLKKDPRVTRLGKLLRKFSIDELPQFFNIISGQMSMVGPRPIVKDEVKYYEDHSLMLFRVLPGATGLWQVSGRSGTSYQKRVELDTRYVLEWSLWGDLKIIVKTIPAVFMRRGAY